MMRKTTARTMALILTVSLLLCSPLTAAAEGFDADPVVIDSEEQTVTVTETATEAAADGAESTEGDAGGGEEGDTDEAAEQTVSVEIPLDTALSREPAEGSAPAAADDASAPSIEYDAAGDAVPA